MVLTADALDEVIISHHATIGGVVVPVREGDILLGAKLPSTSEPLVVAIGSTDAEKLAAKRAAGAAA